MYRFYTNTMQKSVNASTIAILAVLDLCCASGPSHYRVMALCACLLGKLEVDVLTKGGDVPFCPLHNVKAKLLCGD